MSYGKSLATIKSAFKTASPIVKQTTGTYTNGDTLANVKGKATDVVDKEVVSGYGGSLSAVQAEAPEEEVVTSEPAEVPVEEVLVEEVLVEEVSSPVEEVPVEEVSSPVEEVPVEESTAEEVTEESA